MRFEQKLGSPLTSRGRPHSSAEIAPRAANLTTRRGLSSRATIGSRGTSLPHLTFLIDTLAIRNRSMTLKTRRIFFSNRHTSGAILTLFFVASRALIRGQKVRGAEAPKGNDRGGSLAMRREILQPTKIRNVGFRMTILVGSSLQSWGGDEGEAAGFA